MEKAKLEAEIKNLDSDNSTGLLTQNIGEKRTRLGQVEKEIRSLSAAINPETSQGFFRDNLSDANGISLCRFQMAGFRVVLGIIFISSVINVFTMPDFPKELLALIGISSGTYIGYKIPEKQ